MDLSGKNVIYIGGFGGIGRNCLQEFLNRGIKNLAIFDLNKDDALMEKFQKKFGAKTNIFYIKLDITNKENIEAAYKEAAKKLDNRFDVIVNGSGLIDERLVEKTIQINLMGVINSTLTAMSYMDKTKGGCGGLIVNIASVAGLEPFGMFAVYSAAKTGVTAFTRGLSHPYFQQLTGVAFMTICPGLTDTHLLDDPENRQTFPVENSPLAARFNKGKRQTPEVCAKNLVKAIETGKFGAVWMLDLGELKEVTFPVMWQATIDE